MSDKGSITLKTIQVAAAIITKDRKILATERSDGSKRGKWEFPGGKLEPGETAEAAVVREIREELDAEIRVLAPYYHLEYDYPDFHLSMQCFLCELMQPHMERKEHMAWKWLSREELDSVPWLPADENLIVYLKENWF